MRSLGWPLAAALVLGPPALAAAEEPAGTLAGAIDAIFQPTAGKAMPGASVVVLRDGKVVHAKAYGLASLETAEANTTRTRFRLASVSKSFTALLVLQLVEQGRLGLDDPLEKYVPGFVGGERIRIRHLLSHTAGMPDFVSVEQAMKTPPECAPGERLNYSNVGYSVLARVVEKVAGRSYESQLRAALLDPLGLQDTGVDHEKPAGKGAAAGYLFTEQGGVVPAEYTATSGTDAAAGGLHSTAEDMTRWLEALLAGRIVKPETLAQATSPVTLTDGHRGGYGLGFMIIPYRGLREFGHGGDISGFNTYFAVYPDEHLTVIVLSNVGMRPPGPLPTAGDIAHKVVAAVAGGRLGPEWPPVVELSPSQLQRCTGTYRLVAPPPVAAVMGEKLELKLEGAHLFASAKQGQAEIFPESETVFFSKQGPVRITFLPARDGTCSEGVLSLMGLREFRLARER
ncbi:MAG TPA: serine hydrolase domain-containing protein [Vicinamibacteria bacterium]|nr:serine hydrolase domain-containing protein [Vicinamibacteria bacterium]